MVPAAGHPALRTRLAGFYHLVRPQNCLASALATLLGVHLSDGSAGAGPVRVAASMLVVSVVLAASYVVNDLRDADADMLGNPGRAIPSGRVSRREAAGLWWALAAGGSALAFVLGADLGVMAALCAGAGVVYSYWLKGTVLVGNAFVGLVASTPVVFGSMAGGRPTDDTWFAAVVMLLFIFGDEVLKAIGDRVADGAAGLRTIGTQLRLGSGLLVFRAIALCFVGAAILPLALGRAGLLYGAGMLAGAVGPVLWNVWLLTVRPEPASVPVALRLSKKVWFTGLWALWFLG
jgi:4-hydroxybenzoate polyprenyltransferase